MRNEVSGSEIEEALETRAYAEIDKRDPALIEWLMDEPRRMAEIISRIWRKPAVYDDLYAGMLLTMLRNDYINERKYQTDPTECEEIASYILDAEREGAHEY